MRKPTSAGRGSGARRVKVSFMVFLDIEDAHRKNVAGDPPPREKGPDAQHIVILERVIT